MVIAALVVAGYLYLRMDDETRRLAEAALNKACEPLSVRVGSANFVAGRGATGRGVRMRDVEFVILRPGNTPECVLRVEELLVEGQFDVATLLRGKPRIDRIVMRQPLICLTRYAQGDWNFQRLNLPKPSGERPPAVVIQNGSLRIADELRPGSPLLIRRFEASVTPGVGSILEVSATVEESLAKRIHVQGTADPATGGCHFELEIDRATITDGIVGVLADAIARQSGKRMVVPSLRGEVTATATVERSDRQSPPIWHAKFRWDQGQAWVQKIPQPLTAISLSGQASSAGVVIQQAVGRWGETSFWAVGRREGWSPESPVALRCRLERLDLAKPPDFLLTEKLLRLRNRFEPQGTVNVTAEVNFDGRRWSPRATLHASHASFEDTEKFHYRLTKGNGRIDINGGVEGNPAGAPVPSGAGSTVAIDLTALVEGTPVRIAAEFRPPPKGLSPVSRPVAWQSGTTPLQKKPPMPLGWIEISGVGVPITANLMNALDQEGTKRFLRSLNPTGRFDFRWSAKREDPADRKPVTEMDLRLVNCEINYDRFPYPLKGVTGAVQQRGRQWTFRGLQSHDAGGEVRVVCSGDLSPVEEDARLSLRFEGTQIELDESLRLALSPGSQQAWAFLQPRGQIDFQADITHFLRHQSDRAYTPPQTPEVRLSLRPHKRGVALEPAFSTNGYRYRLERLDGQFGWERGRLTMRGARAEHGRTTYATDGTWEATPDGGWQLSLNRLHADRLAFNRDFLLAAPIGLRSVIEALKPQGGFDLFDSTLQITKKGTSGPTSFAAQWDLGLNCHQASIDPGLPIDGISGLLRLNGSTDGVSSQTAGEVDLDSLFWNNLQLTEVRGPLWADGAECLIGEGVGRKNRSEPRRLTAKAYGGQVAINSHIRHGGRLRYGFQTSIQDVDVNRLAAEWLQRPESISGRLNGDLQFQGAGESIYELEGSGKLAISNANLYELPLLVRLLKVLRNRTPDNTAFDRCEAEFDLHGERIAFKHLDLLGDAVSLYGHGEATLDRKLDLTFGSIMGRRGFTIPVIHSFVGQASEQLLRIRVVGTADAPEIRREVLPLVGSMFEQLQSDLSPTIPGETTQSKGNPRETVTDRSKKRPWPTVKY